MLRYHSIRQFSSTRLLNGTVLIPEEPAGEKQYSGVEMSLRYIKISKYVRLHTVKGEAEPEQKDNFIL